ncbi:hypothetical protein COU37_05665 [Candidatus Micrarchaeota archaeon CG10_big_fil_rev_8_21_14_0_10_45_29]|nr:MAG: hypothetical protein COU37_05665 [Candidatus Micrarchaeota archaeon CG10_big_fil_rev_8_21_14_0_10_45_29]
MTPNVNVDISEVFAKKTSAFLLLGIVLFIASAYLNNRWGEIMGSIIISIAIIAQCVNWGKYWRK